jgi:hypothetical protein
MRRAAGVLLLSMGLLAGCMSAAPADEVPPEGGDGRLARPGAESAPATWWSVETCTEASGTFAADPADVEAMLPPGYRPMRYNLTTDLDPASYAQFTMRLVDCSKGPDGPMASLWLEVDVLPPPEIPTIRGTEALVVASVHSSPAMALAFSAWGIGAVAHADLQPEWRELGQARLASAAAKGARLDVRTAVDQVSYASTDARRIYAIREGATVGALDILPAPEGRLFVGSALLDAPTFVGQELPPFDPLLGGVTDHIGLTFAYLPLEALTTAVNQPGGTSGASARP